VLQNSGKRAQYQGGSEDSDRAPKVAVNPVVKQPNPQQNESTAQKCPRRGEPSLQHPGHGHAHPGQSQKIADPWGTEELSQCQSSAGCGQIFRSVGRVLQYVKSIEE